VSAPSIELRGLTKTFGRRDVLSGVNLVVQPGTVFGYLGPNGAGKSTTVKILCGMLADFGGEAWVAGVDVRREPMEVKRRIGYVPENAALYDALTVTELLRFVGRLHDLDDRLVRRRGMALLEAFDLGARAHSRLGALSKGMRQKVLFTTALLHDPALLFLDEPLSGLDVQSVLLVKELIRLLADRGRTLFYCSHVMDVVERVCDRIAILSAGAIVADGTFEELRRRSDEARLEAIFAELTGSADGKAEAARVLEALDA
jgi:ABC-2 type transport system ATP-binding protein